MWQLTGTTAHWSNRPLAARIDLERPDEGVFELSVFERLYRQARLFCTERGDAQGHDLLGEAYVRGTDLVAFYRSREALALCDEIYFRELPAKKNVLGGLELILSAQTDLLGVDPSILVESKLPPGEVQAFCPEGQFRSIPATGKAVLGNSPLAFLFRPASAAWSYVEMAFPTDFVEASVSRESQGGVEWVHLKNRLFAENLEKGVIRRARLRGLFLAREDDAATAAAAYREFSESPPPLTT